MSQVSNAESNNFTKQCIYTALWDLMQDKPYESITITQLAKKAGVSRNAIYRNFDSKDMIIRKRLQEIFDEFIEHIKQNKISSHQEYISILFVFLCEKKEIAEVLLKKSDLTGLLLEAFLYAKGKFNTNIKNEFYENYKIGGIFFVYMTWLLTNCQETPQQLANYVNYILANPTIPPKF